MFSFVIDIKKVISSWSVLLALSSLQQRPVHVTDTGWSVASEDECEELSYEVVMKPTILDVHLALCAGMEALFHTTFSYFAP